MAGDNSVRSLLEKMTESASNAYLSILERLISHSPFFLACNWTHSCAIISALSPLLFVCGNAQRIISPTCAYIFL